MTPGRPSDPPNVPSDPDPPSDSHTALPGQPAPTHSQGRGASADARQEPGLRPAVPSGESISQKYVEAVEASFHPPDDDDVSNSEGTSVVLDCGSATVRVGLTGAPVPTCLLLCTL